MKTIHIGIVVLNYQKPRMTLDCLDSLESLKRRDIAISIVVVDNASKDDSVAIIMASRPDVGLIISDNNLGYGGGNNLGASYLIDAGVDYIWILNNDALVNPDTLDEMLNVIREDPEIGCVGCLIRANGAYDSPPLAVGGGLISWVMGNSKHLKTTKGKIKVDYITGASMLLPRSVWVATGGLSEDYFLYWEDVDFSLRIKNQGWKLAVAMHAVILHDESATLGRGSMLMVYYMNRSFVRFALAHSPFPAWTLFAGISSRMVKRFLMGRWGEARVLWRASLDGWKGRGESYTEAKIFTSETGHR